MDVQDAIWYNDVIPQPITPTPTLPVGLSICNVVADTPRGTVPSRQLERMDSEQALNCFIHGSLPGTAPGAPF